jgi:hypothetical protein
MPHGRASIWLGKVSDEEAAEIESYASRIADARNREQEVPDDVLQWLQQQPKGIRKKLAALVAAGQTVKKCVDEYVHFRKDDLSLKTHNRLAASCEMLVDAFGARLITTITKLDLDSVISGMTYAFGTKRLITFHWQSFFSHAMKSGWIERNPAATRLVTPDSPVTYFIASIEGPQRVKIGFTARTPFNRLSQLRAGSPIELVILGCVAGNRESELHERFRQYHHHGDWFTCSGEILDFVRHECYTPPRREKKRNKCGSN